MWRMEEVLSYLHERNELLPHACGFLPFGISTYFWCGYITFLERKNQVKFRYKVITFARVPTSRIVKRPMPLPRSTFIESTNHQVTEYQLKVCCMTTEVLFPHVDIRRIGILREHFKFQNGSLEQLKSVSSIISQFEVRTKVINSKYHQFWSTQMKKIKFTW